jgi:hypothetical protein
VPTVFPVERPPRAHGARIGENEPDNDWNARLCAPYVLEKVMALGKR